MVPADSRDHRFDCIVPLGRVILYGRVGGWPDSAAVFDKMRQLQGRSPALRQFSMYRFDDDPAARRVCTAALLDMPAQGAITPVIHGRLPLAQAARARALLECGEVIGKLLLEP